MNRQEEILEFGKRLLEERVANDMLEIAEQIQNNSFLDEMKMAFQRVFENTLMQQKTGEKNDVAYVMISYLRSSILTGSYDFLIELYDEAYYYDLTESSGTWSPTFVMKYYENQVKYFEQEAMRNIIRVQQSELLSFERELAGNYYTLVFGILAEHVEEIVKLESFQELHKTDSLTIQYGGLYDITIPIYVSDKEGVDA